MKPTRIASPLQIKKTVTRRDPKGRVERVSGVRLDFLPFIRALDPEGTFLKN
jgi:hypothetical protein